MAFIFGLAGPKSLKKHLYCQQKTFMLLCSLLAAHNRTPPLGGLLTRFLPKKWVHYQKKNRNRKEPITPDHPVALVNKFGNVKASLKDLHLLILFNELSNIKRKGIVFYNAYAKVFTVFTIFTETGLDCENRQSHLSNIDTVMLYSECKNHVNSYS